MNFIPILFIPSLSFSYHRNFVTKAPLITRDTQRHGTVSRNMHYSKTNINAPYHSPSLICILIMNLAWSYKIHSNDPPPALLNREGCCLVGWLNAGGILVKLLPGTYCTRNIQLLPTLKTSRELKREVYHLSLSTLTQTAGEPVQDYVEEVWDVTVWYSAFRKPIKLEICAGKVRNNNNNNNKR